jgi:putative transcriptional regulator
MPYTPIVVDREALTIMGVPFPDLEALESTAEAIGSNMFEGYQPTPKGIEIIRDYTAGKIAFTELIRVAVNKSYEK